VGHGLAIARLPLPDKARILPTTSHHHATGYGLGAEGSGFGRAVGAGGIGAVGKRIGTYPTLEEADLTGKMGQVELIGVGKTYARYKALENIDLRVAPGELLVLVGPSGCGKSTLLRAIAGLETIDHGQIRIGAQVVADTKCHIPPRQRDVAMVFQNYALYPHMSVAENLTFGLRMRGIAKLEREKRVQTIAH